MATNKIRKRSPSVKMAFGNDKSGAQEKATSLRDKLSLIIEEQDLDMIGISEANIWKSDESSMLKIKGFDLITDKLLMTHGRARSAI